MRNQRAYRVYLGMEAFSSFSFALAFTLQTIYFVQTVRLDPLQLVLVGTALEATAFLFEVPTGVVADTFSRRLSIIISYLLLGAGLAIEGLVPAFWAILLVQLITGIGYTFGSGAIEAWVADEVGEENLPAVFVRASQASRAGGLLGIATSVTLGSLALGLPILVAGVLLLVLAGLLVVFMPETGFTPTPREERTTWQAMGHTFREGVKAVRFRPALLTFLAIETFFGMTSEGFDRLGDAHLLANFTFPSLGQLSPVVWFGIIDAVGMVLSIVVVGAARKRLDTNNRRFVVRAAVLFTTLQIACVVAFALAGEFWIAVAVLWARAVFMGLKGPIYRAWLTQSIDSRVRATVLSMTSQANAIGQIAGGPAIGWVGKAYSVRAAIALSGLLLTPVLALYGRAHRQGGPRTEPEPEAETERLAAS